MVTGLNSGYWLERWVERVFLLVSGACWSLVFSGLTAATGSLSPTHHHHRVRSPPIDTHLTASAPLSLWVSVHKSIYTWLSLHLYLSGFLSTNRYTPDCLYTFISLGFCPQIDTHLTASAPLSLWVSVHKSVHT